MNKFAKFFNKFKKIATTTLSVCALTCTMAGTSLLIGSADTTTENVTQLTYTKVAHYEFRDATNLGKDSLGNHNLTNAGGVTVDSVNGGVVVGAESNGYLYETDGFSDTLDGSYSVSLRAYLKSGSGGTNFLASTGYSYSDNFIVQLTYANVQTHLGGGQSPKHNSVLGNSFAWYRMTMIYDETAMTFHTLLMKEGSDTALVDTTTNLTTKVTFGSTGGVFAIGARRNNGSSATDFASDSNGVCPSVSDFRIYSGVIDSTEISAIYAYDENKDTNTDTEETENFTRVAHYEFKDASNLGKDTLGNHNLTNAGGVTVDEDNGGVLIGKESNGYLYAPEDTDGKDFSDSLDGSYSVSTRMYLRNSAGGGNYLFATGSWGSTFTAAWSYEGLSMSLGNGQTLSFGTSATALGGKVMFNNAFAWYRITMIYDETAKTFRLLATKEGDATYSYDYTAALTSNSEFGGGDFAFTIGAHSDPSANAYGQHASAAVVDGGELICPSMSDFRIYSGVIGETELAAIAKYDADNLENIPEEEPDIPPVEEGFVAVAHYEFKDESNLGKDTVGNNHLVATDGVIFDKEKGGVTLKNGVLYAPVDAEGKDFSDYMTGSYSVSMRAYLRQTSGGANYLVATGRYGSSFQVDWASCGFSVNLDSSTLGSFGTSTTAIGGAALFDVEFAWYRVYMIYNQTENTFRVIVSKENNPLYSYDHTMAVANQVSFGGHSQYTFTVGGQSKAGQSVEQHASSSYGSLKLFPNISDIRIYKGVIDETEIQKIAQADKENIALKLNGVFGDNMILQRNKPVKIWGYGGALGSKVTVDFGEQRKIGTVTANGWEVYLDPMPASMEKRNLTVTCGEQTLTIKDILVGELLFCSGQSNIDITLNYLSTKYSGVYDEYSEYQNFNKVRFYKPTWCGKDEENVYTSPYSKWQTPTSAQDLKWVSAYAAGLALHTQAMLGNVPVGVIEVSTGGSCIEEWIDKDNIQSSHTHIAEHNLTPSIYYNGQVHFLKGMTLGGVFWYQGERCIDFLSSYEKLLADLIAQYRNDFEDNDLPVYLMQLPQINIEVAYGSASSEAGWVGMRNVQEKVANSMENVYAVCLIDTGDKSTHNDCIHPADKWNVTERAAGAYVAKTLQIPYEDLAVKGDYGLSPKVVSAIIKDGTLTLSIENATALTVEGNTVNGFKGELANGDEIDLTFMIDGNALKCSLTQDVVSISYLQVASTDVELVFNEYGVPLMPLNAISVTEAPDDSDSMDSGDNSDSTDTSEDTNSSENNDSSSDTTPSGDTGSSSGCNGSINGASLAILPLCFAGIAIACKKKRKQ